MSTDIEWTEETWNPVRGCDPVSPGCANCYAMRQAGRFSGPGKPYEGLVQLTKNGRGYRWTGDFREVPEMLSVPLRRKKPTTWFVNSMSDLFADGVSFEFIAAVLAIMTIAHWHTFQVLTKREQRMREFFEWLDEQVAKKTSFATASVRVDILMSYLLAIIPQSQHARIRKHVTNGVFAGKSNVWLGVSVENAEYLSRIDELRKVDAVIRFVSFEPLLGDLGTVDLSGIHWAIVGGESGNGSRICDIKWIENIIEQCKTANVATFVKQLGKRCRIGTREPTPEEKAAAKKRRKRGELVSIETFLRTVHSKGGDPKEWPEHLQIRQMPEVRQ